MAIQSRKIETLTIELDTEAGALARVYRGFQEAKVNVIASWGYEMGPDQAQAIFYAQDTQLANKTLTQLGFKPKKGRAVFCEGDDKLGTYAEVLTKISKAGVNLHATDALSVNNRFATVFFAEEKDIPALCKAVGC